MEDFLGVVSVNNLFKLGLDEHHATSEKRTHGPAGTNGTRSLLKRKFQCPRLNAYK